MVLKGTQTTQCVVDIKPADLISAVQALVLTAAKMHDEQWISTPSMVCENEPSWHGTCTTKVVRQASPEEVKMFELYQALKEFALGRY